jgi:hypothetical protein
MPLSPAKSKADTFTFRLEPSLKAALLRSASDDQIPPAELVRLLVRRHLAAQARRAFETEARRQSLAVAARANDPNSDEARVMRELDAHFDDDDFAAEWTA